MRVIIRNGGHKLILAAFLLVLFAIPFAISRQAIIRFDSKALMAGGAVIGHGTEQAYTADASDGTANQAQITTGRSFTGALAR